MTKPTGKPKGRPPKLGANPKRTQMWFDDTMRDHIDLWRKLRLRNNMGRAETIRCMLEEAASYAVSEVEAIEDGEEIKRRLDMPDYETVKAIAGMNKEVPPPRYGKTKRGKKGTRK